MNDAEEKTQCILYKMIYYLGCDFSDYCPHLYCGKFKHN